MIELTSLKQDEITITAKTASVTINVAEGYVDGNLAVGKIYGPGEFEIGEIAVKGIAVGERKILYDIEAEGIKIAVTGDIEEGLDELPMVDILCTTSVRAVREIEPKLVVAMGNIDGMVMELKVPARAEKKLRLKSAEALPAALEVISLG